MKLVPGLALATASLLSMSAHATTPDPAPTLATDTQGTTLAGAHHLTGAAFSLIVTDWWLTGVIVNGQAQDMRLVVEVHLPTYPLLDHATDAAGRKLDVVILNRGPSARWRQKASERVAVVLPRDYAEKARTTGLDITVSGKDRGFPVVVPADTLARFLDSYAQAAGSVGTSATTPAPGAPMPAPPAPVTSPPAPAVQQAPARVTPPPSPASPIPQSPRPAAPPQTPMAQSPTAQAATPQVIAKPPTTQAGPAGSAPDDNDPAITPIQDKRVRLPSGAFAPAPPPPPPAPAPAAPPPADTSATDSGSGGGHGIWIDSLGLQFVATSSGALVLTTRPGSIAAAKGIESGDFIEAVDGAPITTLNADQMAARIGAPGVKVLHMIAVGDVKLR